ncbi:MAG: D-alanyl-D-alanine carboxypeptidase [Clostridia bacterium]|nr:D-alanyl-D-alanine carboxypeptidase [Clostridia bacterium]
MGDPMLRKTASFLLLLFVFSFGCSALDSPSVSAQSAVVMAADSRELIYGKNEHEQRGMASTTKIMTALLTLECASPQKQVTVTEQMVAVEGTSMGLLPGDKVTYRDLVYGMLLASGNDAANTAAISISGSIAEFAKLMNNRAVQIGMHNTSFVTPSGLDDENHYSTAFDMALLGCEAITNSDFLLACSSVQAELCYGNEPYTRYLSNHNKLLKTFDGAVGIKTGFTKKSGRCLVSAAERNGVTLVCVTLNAPNDWQDHKALLEYGFEQVSLKALYCSLPQVTVYGGEAEKADVELSEPLSVATQCSPDRISAQIIVKPYFIAPLKKGDIAGEVRISVDGKTVKSVPVKIKDDVKSITQEVFKKPSLLKRLAEKISGFFCRER